MKPLVATMVTVLLLTVLIGCSSPKPPPEPEPEPEPGQNTAAATAAVDAEQLQIIPPKGWTLVSSSNQGDFRRAHYVRDPDAEVIESLTLEAFPAEGLSDPLAFLDGLAANEADRCDDFSREPTFAGEERGRRVAVELHRCPRRPVNGKATVGLIKVIQGDESYAVITLAKEARAQGSAEGWQIDFVEEGDVARWALYLKNAYLERGAPAS